MKSINKGKFYQYQLIDGSLRLADIEPNYKEAIIWANKARGRLLVYCVDDEIVKDDGSEYEYELLFNKQ